MRLILTRRTNPLTPVGWRFVWIGLALLLAGWPLAGLGQEAPVEDEPGGLPGMYSRQLAGQAPAELEDPSDGGGDFLFSDRFTGRSGQALGALIRGGFVTGPGVGREDGFAPIEFMPYFFSGNGMLFGDLRGFRTTQDHYGANTGFGYRHYLPGLDRIIGVNAFFDYDNSSSKVFRQYGFGAETYGAGWDMRLNTYFPVGEINKNLSIELLQDTIRYSGNRILFDQLRIQGTAMKGLDHELGVPLPGRILERHDVRAYAGWYHFQSDAARTWGWKGRIQANVLPNFNLGLEVTNDKLFDTNVVLSAALSYGGFRQPEYERKTQFSRMTTPIQRQYNIVIGRIPIIDQGLVALKADGTPYFVEHVASYSPGPVFDGTVENPYLTVADAQAVPGGDIVFVHANSQYDGIPITLEQGVRLLGEGDGVTHLFFLQQFGTNVPLPRAVDNPATDANGNSVVDQRPLFTNIPGDGVTLVSGRVLPNGAVVRTEFSGFQVGSPTDGTSGPSGNGIVGDNVTAVDVRYNDINYAGADGVLLTNITGELVFEGNRILNAAANGLHIDGEGTGGGLITFDGDGVFNNDFASADIVFDPTLDTQTGLPPTGDAVLIENTVASSFVNLFRINPAVVFYGNALSNTPSTQSGGVEILNSLGSARFGNILIGDTRLPSAGNGVGINVVDSAGTYNFASPVVITRPADDGIHIENLAQGGNVRFGNTVQIRDRAMHGIDLLNNDGNVTFQQLVTIGSFPGTNNINPFFSVNSPAAAAIEYQESSGDATFATVALDGGAGSGILIGQVGADPVNVDATDNTGTFTISGTASGSTISNFLGVSLLIEQDASVVRIGSLAINERGNTGILIDQHKDVLTDAQGAEVVFNGPVSVTNLTTTAGSPRPVSLDTAIVIQNNLGDVAFTSANGSQVQDAQVAANLFNDVAGVAIFNNPGNVLFNRLDIINTVFGVGLGADSVGGVTATDTNGLEIRSGGIIQTVGDEAVLITNSVMFVNLDSVESINPLGNGIQLVDNIGFGRGGFDFSVTGGTLPNGFSGGQVVGATQEGIFLQNTGLTFFSNMFIDGNTFEGVRYDVLNANAISNVPYGLNVQNSTITNNANVVGAVAGIWTRNVPNVTLNNNIINNNGLGIPLPEVRLQAGNLIDPFTNLRPTYSFVMNANQITEVGADAVVVESLPQGASAPLFLRVQNGNRITMNLSAFAGIDALFVNWLGNIDAIVSNNTFVLNDPGAAGARNDAIHFNNNNLNTFSVITVQDNDISGGGNFQTGVEISTTGTSSIAILGTTTAAPTTANPNPLRQQIRLLGDSARGVDLTLAAGSNTSLVNNIIDLREAGEGVRFNFIAAPATVRMDGNEITVLGAPINFPDDEFGVRFLVTQGTINFNGSVDNFVELNGLQFSGFPWFDFVGSFQGTVLINGVPEPP